MSGSQPEHVLDPVCGMTVAVAQAEADGLTVERDGRTYAFCRSGCLRAFQEEPALYAAKADQAHVISAPQTKGLPVIDEGMRLWYESCSCCLSDAFPDVKAALDAERAAKDDAPANAGMSDGPEAHEVATP
ncbi:MAG TPA: YHS domain-containing protein [Aeromicrobium sp.]|nr:YHS domain-containing protein [Aeromicrobium sp.]